MGVGRRKQGDAATMQQQLNSLAARGCMRPLCAHSCQTGTSGPSRAAHHLNAPALRRKTRQAPRPPGEASQAGLRPTPPPAPRPASLSAPVAVLTCSTGALLSISSFSLHPSWNRPPTCDSRHLAVVLCPTDGCCRGQARVSQDAPHPVARVAAGRQWGGGSVRKGRRTRRLHAASPGMQAPTGNRTQHAKCTVARTEASPHNPHDAPPALTHRSGPSPMPPGWGCAPRSPGEAAHRPSFLGRGPPPGQRQRRCWQQRGWPQAGRQASAPVPSLHQLPLRHCNWHAASNGWQARRRRATAAGRAVPQLQP